MSTTRDLRGPVLVCTNIYLFNIFTFFTRLFLGNITIELHITCLLIHLLTYLLIYLLTYLLKEHH